MKKENPDRVTFDRLKQFLRELGFSEPRERKLTLSYFHPVTNTLIVLSIPPDGKTVRGADMLSVATRLEYAGLVTDSVLDQFKSGFLPAV